MSRHFSEETRCLLRVDRDWRGAPLAPTDRLAFELSHQGDLVVSVDAPFWPEPAPSAPAGRVPELWQHSVAELFIWGGEERYLELELGPYGHWWLLELAPWRQRCREDLTCEYSVERRGTHWHGEARIAEALLPARPWRLSGCAIWGSGERNFAMSRPTRAERPDFHVETAFAEPW